MKQTGARSAPGKPEGICFKIQGKYKGSTKEMKQIRRAKRAGNFLGYFNAKQRKYKGKRCKFGARSAPENFWIILVQKQRKYKGKRSKFGARSAPGNFGSFWCKIQRKYRVNVKANHTFYSFGFANEIS